MKIAQVEAIVLRVKPQPITAARAAPQVSLPGRALDEGYDFNRTRATYPLGVQTVLVRIKTDDGLVGYGEAHAPLAPEVAKAIIDNLLGPVILGQDTRAVEVLWERMYSSMRIRGHRTGFMMEAISGVDIALWDLFGKATDLPVYALLGGRYRDLVNVYASGVPGLTVEEQIESARQFIAQGFTAMKMGTGGVGITAGAERVRQVSEAIGNRAHLMVDAQGGYDLHTALEFGRKLQDYGVYWVEDPLPPEDIDGHRQLADALHMAVATGEAFCTRYGFREWLTGHAADIILPDICRAGGISECRKIANMADAFNIPWAAHASMGTALHIAASVHLGAATPNFLICEYPSRFAMNPLGNNLLVKPLSVVAGKIPVSQEPGLGIEFDEEALAACTVAGQVA